MDEVADAYEAVADRYIELFGHTSSVHPDDLAVIERHLTPSSRSVLDAGCGPGHLTAHLASRGADPIGVDAAPSFVDHARRTTGMDRFAIGSLRSLPLRDRSVSGLLAWYSLIHLPPNEVGSILAELRRVAADGATLVAGFFDGDLATEFAHKVTTAHVWPIDELSALLPDVGFREVARLQRASDPSSGTRAQATLVAVAR